MMTDLQVRRIGYAMGAAVLGLDLRDDLSDALIASIRAAWLEHLVLCFPGQDLAPEEFRAFCSRFGELDDFRGTPHVRHPEHNEVMVLVNKTTTVGSAQYKGNINDGWHTDLSFTDRPASASFLVAKILPEVGGDTAFANMYLAYETLSPAMQRLIDPLEAVHDVALDAAFRRNPPEVQALRRQITPPVVHPVVRVHPETGRKALYLGDRIRTFAGMTEEETKPLAEFLNAHAVRYELTYRHRWTAGDVVMWDNRCTLHRAIADYAPGQARQLWRCSLLAPKSGRILTEETAPAR